MAPSNNRFGSQLGSETFPHLQQPRFPTQTTQHHTSNSSGLPPPSLHHGFAQGNLNNINPFAPTGNLNGLAGGFGAASGLGTGGTGLASREAVMGFQHGALLQQQQQAREQIRRGSGVSSKVQMKSRIRDVWQGNLHQEMKVIRELVERYPYISMVGPFSAYEPFFHSDLGRTFSDGRPLSLHKDTEFPGIVARPMGAFTTKADYHYQVLRCNVDLLRVIQLGITLFDEDGNVPPPHPTDESGLPLYQSNNLIPCPCTWQFNFQFSLTDDMYNQESIDFLIKEAGLDLERNHLDGINPQQFGSLLVSSGLVFFEDVRWISFHSGYDFGYLVKIMLQKPLPGDETEYRKLLSVYFPAIYDIKYMIKDAQKYQTVNETPLSPGAMNILSNLGQKSGLQDLADELGIKRTGTAHQAGSDSLLTGRVFWEVKKSIFHDAIDDSKFLGQIWGLHGMGSSGPTQSINASTPSTHTTNNADTQPDAPVSSGAPIYGSNPGQATPGTPASSHPGLASTPQQQIQSNGGGIGPLTPGGGGGVFGGFRGFGKG